MPIRMLFIALCWLCWSPSPALADALRAAVASNFVPTAERLGELWQQRSGHRLDVVSGATGLLYAQLRAGAPFDVFLAADAQRPALLEADGLLVANSRSTYALGRLVLWVPGQQASTWLQTGSGRLAIADPRLAPYGRAAMETLACQDVLPGWRERLVRGTNVGQSFHFVASGAVPGALLALAQLRRRRPAEVRDAAELWIVPEHCHAPIVQQAGALRASKRQALALDFLAFLASDAARAVIVEEGYRAP